MLLNKENLLLLSKESQEEKTKLDRVLSYIRDQKAYCSNYTSPNHSVAAQSTSSAVSGSVDDQHPTVKTRSSTLDEYSVLPHTKSNGFHLLQKFSSPNLEINRITVKQNRPKLGLFNKGKSSAQATKAVPDLVFSEEKFLKKRKQDSPDTLKPETKSKFFKQKSDTVHSAATHRSSLYKQARSKESSNQSLKRILKECQDAPRVVLDNYFRHSSPDSYYYDTRESNTAEPNQVPTYAPVKTPIHRIAHDPIVISETSSHRHQTGSQLDLSNNESTKSPELEDTLDLLYKSHQILGPNKINSGLVNWQIESLSGSLEDTKEEYSNDILNFWEHQYKRTL